MSKKVISILLSAAMLVAMLCVGFGSVTAAADDTYTYYFLAPDSFCNPDKGAANNQVGAYWWQPSEPAPWWGVEMTPAPEKGDNIYKIEVPVKTGNVIFNAAVDAGTPADPALEALAHQTKDINTEGYEDDCPYDESVATDNFDGWIYVLNLNDKDVNALSGATTTGGAWFTFDNYKNYADYYGTYGFADDAADTDAATDAKYKAGDVVEYSVKLNNLTIDGEKALLGAFNYTVSYDPEKVTYVAEDAEEEQARISGGNILSNDNGDSVELGAMKAKGYKDKDYTGEEGEVFVIKFTVNADTDDLGISGECTSLTVMSEDGQSTATLIGVDTPDDGKYATLEIVGGEPDTDSEPTPPDSDSDPEPIADDTDTTGGTDTTPGTDTKPGKPSDADKASDSDKTGTTDKDASDSDKAPVKPDTDSSTKGSDSDSDKKNTNDKADSSSDKKSSDSKSTTSTSTTTGGTVSTVQTAGTFAVVSLVVILMAAAAVVLYTRKKSEE